MKLNVARCLTLIAAAATLRSPPVAAEAESPLVVVPNVARYSYDAIPKDPLASAFFSATICGTGQIYNKEYLSGIATGATFWASYFTVYYMVQRYIELNTDTFFVAEYYSPNTIHEVKAMRPDNRQVGLPSGEKAILVTALITGATSYVWGIVDSYRGAQRYNRKLFASAPQPQLYAVCGRRSELGLQLKF